MEKSGHWPLFFCIVRGKALLCFLTLRFPPSFGNPSRFAKAKTQSLNEF